MEFEEDLGDKAGFLNRITQPFMVARFIKYAVSLFALLLVVFFVLRPLIGFILSRDSGANAVNSLPDGSRGQLEGGGVKLALEGSPGSPALKGLETVKTMAGQDARKFAEVLENWL
jgi:flagellar biosynthesis/type III secretory pathway M-ring protein FliF/YscJ